MDIISTRREVKTMVAVDSTTMITTEEEVEEITMAEEVEEGSKITTKAIMPPLLQGVQIFNRR